MSREDVLNAVRATLGIVPGWLEGMPDQALQDEWSALKGFVLVDTTLPVKTKALIGLGAAAALRCRY